MRSPWELATLSPLVARSASGQGRWFGWMSVGSVVSDGVDRPTVDLEGGEVVGLPGRAPRRPSVDGSLSLPLQVADGGAGRLLLHGQVAPVLEAEGVDLEV